MKIAYITNVRLPTERAHGYALMKMSEEFSRAGADVTLVVPRKRDNVGAEPFSYYDISHNFSLRALPAWDFLGRRLGGAFMYGVDLAGFLFLLLITRPWGGGSVVYTRDYLIAAIVPKRVILELHSLPRRGPLFQFALRRVEKIVVISNGLKEDLASSYGVEGGRILVAPDAVDMGVFKPVEDKGSLRHELGIPADKKVVLYTGHLYGWKGADTLAEAARGLGKDALVVFVGGVDNELKRFVEKYGNVPNIKVVPFQPREVAAKYMASADVLVLPNTAKSRISSRYTSPLKLFEYMASGVPIVASDLPSIREILNEQNAVLVEPDNPGALAVGIVQVLENPTAARERSGQALRDVQKYSWGLRAQKILAFIA